MVLSVVMMVRTLFFLSYGPSPNKVGWLCLFRPGIVSYRLHYHVYGLCDSRFANLEKHKTGIKLPRAVDHSARVSMKSAASCVN